MKTTRRALSCMLILLGCLSAASWLAALSDDALVYEVNIRDAIGNGLRVHIENGVRKAETAEADAIIFDIDTPGGAVDAAIRIIRAIQATSIPTIAYVNRQAISAGALISLACDQIVMRSGATIGDAAPVTIQGQELGEKAVSYIRATIRSTAERQGRNTDVAAAMVDKRLYLVRQEDGELVALRPAEYDEKKEAGESLEVIAAGGEDGELLTVTTEEAMRYNLSEAQVDTIEELLSIYRIVEVNGQRTALTEDAVSAMQSEPGGDEVEIIKSLKGATLHEVESTLADHFVLFITGPMISAMLLALGGLGLWVEIQSPGFGFPGIIGIVCLALVFGGHRLLNLGVDYAILAFIVGVGLLMLEFFVIPGFGVAGIAGIALIFGSFFFVFRNAYEFKTAITSLSASVIIMFAAGIVLAYTLPKTRTWNHFVLETALDASAAPPADTSDSYLGRTGVAITPLRPSGTIRIDDRRLDVVTVGDFIEADTPVKVMSVEGTKIFVEADNNA